MRADLDLGHTRLIITTCMRYGLWRNQAAYVLATTYWETARTMKPVRETMARSDESAITRLENAWVAGRLPWVSTPYWRKDGNGQSWFGRGFVQLTWKRNYEKAGSQLGIDLTSDPGRALEPDIAAAILVEGMRDGWFTGKKLSDYITLKRSNYRGARRVVNGTDKASTIAELARDYEAALLAENYGVEKPTPVVEDRRDGTPPRKNPAQSKTIWAQVTQWGGAVGALGTTWWNAQSEPVQLAVIGGGAVMAVTGIIVLRERLKHWANGVR